MLSLLITLLEDSNNDGLKYALTECYKNLLDPNVNEHKLEFFDVFYEKLLPKLIDYLAEFPIKRHTRSQVLSQHLIFELLNFCIANYKTDLRYYIINTGMLIKLEKFYTINVKSVRLDMIRLIRNIISMKDEAFYRHLVKNDLFKCTFKILRQMKRESTIYCAILELFNYITKGKIKTVIEYLGEKYYEEICRMNAKAFKDLREEIEITCISQNNVTSL